MQLLNLLLVGAGLACALRTPTTPQFELIEHRVLHPNGSTVSVFEHHPSQTQTSTNRRSIDWFVDSNWDAMYSMCGDTTWAPHISASSPLVSDCEGIAAHHDQKNLKGYYMVREFYEPGTFQGLFSSGTCNFGIRPKTAKDANGIYAWYIGSQDIRDLVIDSIRKFSKGGKVGVEGDMTCTKGESAMDVHWGIYGY